MLLPNVCTFFSAPLRRRVHSPAHIFNALLNILRGWHALCRLDSEQASIGDPRWVLNQKFVDKTCLRYFLLCSGPLHLQI